MQCKHSQGVVDIALWLGALGHSDAVVCQVRWSQVHLDQAEVDITAVLSLRVIGLEAVP